MSGIAPRLVNAPHNYDAQNEAQFRASVHRALQDTFGGVNDRLSSGTGFPTSIKGWVHNVAFSATDHDTVEWASGTITLGDGTTYAIGAGNTGNMTVTSYIFLDIGVSATALQVTATASNSVGLNRILVAVATPSSAPADATFIAYGGGQDILVAPLINLASQVSGTLTSAFADAGLINSNVTVNADGTLTGAGGGQVSLVSLPGTIAAGQIAANAVTTAKLNALAITAGKIQAGAIETAKLAANAVTADKITANTITATQIAANTITANEIAANTITATEIAAGTITANEIVADTITATQIAANTITAAQIAADAITATEIDVSTLSAVAADMGTLTAGKIDVGNIEINAGTERILFGAATAPTSGVGIFMGKDGSDYEFRAGNPSGNYIHWDGSVLTVNGVVAGTAFTGGALVFDGTGEFKAGDGKTRVKINADSAGGRVQLYYGSTPDLISDIYAGANNFLYIDGAGPINFSGPSTLSHAKPDMRWDGNQWGPRARDSDTESTNSVGSWGSLHSVGWAGDSSFETGWVEFMGKANGSNDTKMLRITVNGTQVWDRNVTGSRNGAFWVKMMIANNEGSTTAQRGYVVSDFPAASLRTDTTYFTSSVNTGTTALTIALEGQVANASDSVDCDFAYAYGLARPD